MEYQFLDVSDEQLIEISELPVEGGIAVSIRTTGYSSEADEVLQIAIADFEGNELLSEMVKPQNKEDWSNDDASGGITPADVAEAPELYQFEDEIMGLFENASIVVASHAGFVKELIEASWVSLPDFKGVDLVDLFCSTHSTLDYPDQPAAVATPEAIAGYYSVGLADGSLDAKAKAAAACYLELVKEHVDRRDAKGERYWEEYQRKLEEDRKSDLQAQALSRGQERRVQIINAVLWLCAAAIFSNLAVQMYTGGTDVGLVAVVAAAAVFFVIRWLLCLYKAHKLKQ